MGALDAGGLHAIHDPDRTKSMSRALHSDEQDTNESYWEPSGKQWCEWDFPLQYDRVESRAVKVLNRQISLLTGDNEGLRYGVVILKRHPEEIRQSYNAMFHRVGKRAPPWLDYTVDGRQMDEYLKRISWMREMVELRPDMRLLGEFWFREDVVARPLEVFTQLRNLGMPIDPRRAAATIDPSRVHAKFEDLVKGI